MEFKSHAFPGDDTDYVAPSWFELQQLSFDIAKQIRASGKTIDRIITLARGGWPMTRCLIDFLDIQGVASIGVKFYSGINQRLEKPHIYQDLPVSVVDERVLLFDDVADTGTSLKFTRQYLLEFRGVKEVTTATLLTKPQSVIQPDFFGAETTAWIIFPYDVADMVFLLTERWKTQGVSKDDMPHRFAELGFDSEWIEYFVHEKTK